MTMKARPTSGRFRLHPKLHAKANAEATARGISLSDLVRAALEDHLSRIRLPTTAGVVAEVVYASGDLRELTVRFYRGGREAPLSATDFKETNVEVGGGKYRITTKVDTRDHSLFVLEKPSEAAIIMKRP